MTDATTTVTDTTTTTEAAAPVAETTQVTEQTTETNTTETVASTDGDEGTLLGGTTEAPPAQAETPAGAPEAYEITLTNEAGEAIPLDQEIVAEASEAFRELNLTNEQANKLAPLALKLAQKHVAAAEEQAATMISQARKDWLEAFKADPELGGAKTDETLHIAARGLDALGYKEGHPFRELLNISGLGNHPDMIRVFHKLGSVVGEETTFASPEGVSDNPPTGWADLYKDGKEPE